LKAIAAPVCLVLAKQGVSYPENIFQARAEAIQDLTIHQVEGGHHVHMDNPQPVAEVISQFLMQGENEVRSLYALWGSLGLPLSRRCMRRCLA
jgi:hypothetical protein